MSGKYLVQGFLIVALLGTMVAVGIVLKPDVHAQTFSPYSDFQAMTLQQLATLQVKLTYVGVQEKGVPSLAFTSTSNVLNLSLFVSFRRPQISYSNDDLAKVMSFSASTQELKAVIDNVATLPAVTAGGVASDVFLAFTLLNTDPSTKAFEAVLNSADTAALFNQLRNSLANNKEGLAKLEALACALNVLQGGTPADVSANVSVDISGLRLNRTTGRFVGTATVTNKSGGTLATPVSVVFVPTANVRLGNADGSTCSTTPTGAPFKTLSGSLGAGQSAAITVEFENPDRANFNFTTKVLAGPGAR